MSSVSPVGVEREPAGPAQPAVSPWTYVLLATVPLNWGFNFISLKVLKQSFTVAGPLAGVYGLLSVRYVLMVAALLLTLWALERDITIRREHWRYLLGFAFVTVVVYQGCFAAGVFYTLAAESALLISTAPIWAAIINHVLGWERLSLRQAVGTLIGFLGIAAVIVGGLKGAQKVEYHALGLALMVLAGVLWACYAVFSKPLLKHYSPLKVNFWAHALGAVALIPLGLRDALAVDWASLSVETWVYFFYFAWLAGVYGFVVWFRGVAAIGSSKTMLFQYCVPLVATVVAYFLIREVPTPVQVLGIAVTLVGLQLAVPGRQPAPEQPPVTVLGEE